MREVVVLLNTEWSISSRRWAACSWRVAASARISWNWQTPTFADPSLTRRRPPRNSTCPLSFVDTISSPCMASHGRSPPRPRRNNGSICPPLATNSCWTELNPVAASLIQEYPGPVPVLWGCLPLAAALVFLRRSFQRRKFFSDWCPTVPPRILLLPKSWLLTVFDRRRAVLNPLPLCFPTIPSCFWNFQASRGNYECVIGLCLFLRVWLMRNQAVEWVPCTLHKSCLCWVEFVWVWVLPSFEPGLLLWGPNQTIRIVLRWFNLRLFCWRVLVIFYLFRGGERQACDCTPREWAARAVLGEETLVTPFDSSKSCRSSQRTPLLHPSPASRGVRALKNW